MINALVLSLVTLSSGYDYTTMISVEISMAVSQPTPIPAPGPGPVTDICDNCRGTGRVGDGTVSVTCPVCEGTGKKPRALTLAETTPGGGGRWTYPGDITTHLMTSHGYSRDDLAGMTHGQMLTLHDRAHEGATSYVGLSLKGDGDNRRLYVPTPLRRADGERRGLPRPLRRAGSCLFGRCG